MIKSDHRWPIMIIALVLLSSLVISIHGNDNDLQNIVNSVNDQNQKKSKSSSEEVFVETEDEATPPEATNVKYSEPINDLDISSAIKILTAPDLSQPDEQTKDKDSEKNKANIKNLDNLLNFKFILDNDPWVENFKVAIKSSLEESNTLENQIEEHENDAVGEKNMETEMTPEQLEAHNKYLEAMKLINSHSSNKAKGYLTMFQAAGLGSVDAKIHLAWAQLFGTHVNQNIVAANETFHTLAEEGNPDAQMGLGFLYSSGLGVNVSLAKSLVYYTFSAIGGNQWAQMALGYRYYAGISVTTSCEKALDFYKIAAAKVAKDVTLSGGQMIHRIRLMEEADASGYNAGILDKDLFEYYQLLANKGDVTAQVGLGQLHFQGGRGIPLDYEKAHHYFLQAAEANNPIALGFLGRMYLEGNEYVKQDNKTAFTYFKKSADQNNPVGQSGLGLMYMRGQGAPQDYSEAFRFFQLAAEQGWVDGQLHLGVMYHKGLGVRRDYKTAVKYFTLASQSGHVMAYYNLAQMHAAGTGLMRSCSTAVDLYKNVVERGRVGEKLMEAYTLHRDGHGNAAFIIYALLSDLGYDVAQSNAAHLLDRNEVTLWPDDNARYTRALVYWARSAAQGYSPAQVKLGDYHYYGWGTAVDYEIAAMHYRLASESQHNAQAFFNLGYMHEQGLGMSQDIHLAKRCYDMAAETSADAKVPAALALLKLSLLFSVQYLQEIKWQHWDLYLLGLLIPTLATLLFMKLGYTNRAHQHQE
uniref:Protein sel-1 homolog 1 n=1 Tax=Cacopsylla melanoneura TaxID=428564 RepID=A0A8D8X045_9HEMI